MQRVFGIQSTSRPIFRQFQPPISFKNSICVSRRASKEETTGPDLDDKKSLIRMVHELRDKIEALEGELAEGERRDRERMIALRSIIKDSILRASHSNNNAAVGCHGTPATGTADFGAHSEDEESMNDLSTTTLNISSKSIDDQANRDWESYRNSFTLLMTKGYLETVEQLRDKLLATDWELGYRPIALQLGVSKFESWCATNGSNISFDAITKLYNDPTDLDVVEDVVLRMHARAVITAVENEHLMTCFNACTGEARKLAQQFSEGEFISKLLPEPIEAGVVSGLKHIIRSADTMSKFLSGGK